MKSRRKPHLVQKFRLVLYESVLTSVSLWLPFAFKVTNGPYVRKKYSSWRIDCIDFGGDAAEYIEHVCCAIDEIRAVGEPWEQALKSVKRISIFPSKTPEHVRANRLFKVIYLPMDLPSYRMVPWKLVVGLQKLRFVRKCGFLPGERMNRVCVRGVRRCMKRAAAKGADLGS